MCRFLCPSLSPIHCPSTSSPCYISCLYRYSASRSTCVVRFVSLLTCPVFRKKCVAVNIATLINSNVHSLEVTRIALPRAHRIIDTVVKFERAAAFTWIGFFRHFSPFSLSEKRVVSRYALLTASCADERDRTFASHKSVHSSTMRETGFVSGVSPLEIPMKNRSIGRLEFGLTIGRAL